MNFRPKFVDLFSLVSSKGRTHTLTDSKRGKIRKMTILRYETSLRNPRVVMMGLLNFQELESGFLDFRVPKQESRSQELIPLMNQLLALKVAPLIQFLSWVIPHFP